MKFAFVFPGQGSQSVGMLDGFADHPTVAQTITEASAALGENLGELIDKGPTEDLGLTTNTQPAMLAAGVAVYRAWRAAGGLAPVLMAGHSLGEYSALVAAGALEFGDAVRLVRLRAQAMQQAVPVGVGAMAAILGLESVAVVELCREASADEVVEAVNFNEPSQTVIAGHRAAVERACELARARGAKRALLLNVSAPFHSSLMKAAAQELALGLNRIVVAPPAIGVVNNVDVAIESEPARISAALVRQACQPVRWVEVISALRGAGVTHIIECGPGKVLAGMTRRIDRELVSASITDSASLSAALEFLR